jgi:hypothetical protein
MDIAQKGERPVEIEMELCELSALSAMLSALPAPDLLRMADDFGIRLPPKRRQKPTRALLEEWARPSSRDRLRKAMAASGAQIVAMIREGRVRAALDLMDRGLPVPMVLWASAEAGLSPETVVRRLGKARRERLRAELEEAARLAEWLQKVRAGKVEAGRQALRKAERAIKALRWQAAKEGEKHERAEEAARRLAEENARLRAELDEARQRIKALEEERLILVDQIAAATIERPRPVATETAGRPLEGLSVLVVGDEGRQVEYLSIIEEMGAEAAFVSGFGNPRQAAAMAARADVVVFVTAYATHKMWTAIKGAKRPLVPVNQAGERAFREAVSQWRRGA